MIEINNTTAQKINQPKIKKIVNDFLVVHKKNNWEVSIAVISASRMRKLNDDYRGIDKTTDVLSFSGEGRYLGEVIINIEEVKKSHKYLEVFGIKKSAEYIFYFLLIHGLLHLIGHTDDKEKERARMLKIGETFLEKYF
jgi:probable rRNA maturation factor